MTDKLKELLAPPQLKSDLFPPTSRYHGIETARLESVDGKTIAYLRRRFVPPPEQFALLQEHTVVQGDRVDNLSAQYFGDPEQFWRLCDANGVICPDALIERTGRNIRVTLPEGIPGMKNG